jgi:2-polyprenyl-3-methyl-5-hydroxy-6-metoxy-1,4-benzoquinol methylase
MLSNWLTSGRETRRSDGFTSFSRLRSDHGAEMPDVKLRENVFGHVKKVMLIQAALERLRESRPSLSVLDVGCGNGSAVTHHIVTQSDIGLGIDLHEDSIQYAQANFGRAGLRFSNIPIERVTDSYDAIVFADVLEHVSSPEALLTTARRLLRPNGRVLVTVPNGYGPFEWESALSRLPWVGRVSIRLTDTIVAVLNRFIVKGAWSRVVPDRSVPYNDDSGHIQFFARTRFLDLVKASGFTVVSARNLSLLSGPYTNYFMAPSEQFCRFNNWLADRLPARVASAWFFELKPTTEETESESRSPQRRGDAPSAVGKQGPLGVTIHVDKIETQRQWDEDPCGANTVKDERPGSLGFYRAARIHRYQVYAPWFDDIVRFDEWAGKDVLEIGVGLGSDHFRFAAAGARMTAVDLSTEHLRHTRRHLAAENLTSHATRGDAETLPFRDQSFDLVYAFGVLHHTPDIMSAVHEVHRVLRPGGTAIIGLYHRNSVFFFVQTILFNGILKMGLVRKGWRRLLSEIEYRSSENAAVPLVTVYSRAAVLRMFSHFRRVEVTTRHLEASHFSLLSVFFKRLSRSDLERRLGRFGWYLIVRATK